MAELIKLHGSSSFISHNPGMERPQNDSEAVPVVGQDQRDAEA